jgi:hypothetical protein
VHISSTACAATSSWSTTTAHLDSYKYCCTSAKSVLCNWLHNTPARAPQTLFNVLPSSNNWFPDAIHISQQCIINAHLTVCLGRRELLQQHAHDTQAAQRCFTALIMCIAIALMHWKHLASLDASSIFPPLLQPRPWYAVRLVKVCRLRTPHPQAPQAQGHVVLISSHLLQNSSSSSKCLDAKRCKGTC